MSEIDRVKRARELTERARERPEEVLDEVETLVFFADDSSARVALNAVGGVQALSESHPEVVAEHAERIARIVVGSEDPERNYDLLRALLNVVAVSPGKMDVATRAFSDVLDVTRNTATKELTITLDALESAIQGGYTLPESDVRSAVSMLGVPDIGVQRRVVSLAETVLSKRNPGEDLAAEGLTAALADGADTVRTQAALAIARVASARPEVFDHEPVRNGLEECLGRIDDPVDRETVESAIETLG